MVVETLVAIGAGTAAISTGITATAVAVNWRKYAKSEWASVTGNSFLKHCWKKHFQRNVGRRKGYAGEHELSMQLEKVRGNKTVLYNVLIPAGKDKTTEIDALMIHETGIYVFENKNYGGVIGSVYVNRNNEKALGNINPCADEWTVLYGNNAKSLYNPLKQNDKHLYFIKRFLDGFNVGTQRLFSYVTFNDDAKVKGAPLDFQFAHEGCMLMVKHVADDLEAKMGQRSKILSPQKIASIAAKLEPYSRVSNQERKEHAERVSAAKEQINGKLERDVNAASHAPLNVAINQASEQAEQLSSQPKRNMMKDYMNMFRG